jgi:hypothetical protein
MPSVEPDYSGSFTFLSGNSDNDSLVSERLRFVSGLFKLIPFTPFRET